MSMQLTIDPSIEVGKPIAKCHRCLKPLPKVDLSTYPPGLVPLCLMCGKKSMKECYDCGGPIGQDGGPPNGWRLEDGRTVCQACCIKDTKAFADNLIKANGWDNK